MNFRNLIAVSSLLTLTVAAGANPPKQDGGSLKLSHLKTPPSLTRPSGLKPNGIIPGAGKTTHVMDFDTDASGAPIADGTTIGEQYAAWGAHFLPNPFFGATNFTGFPFASNTDMTATSTDVGFGYDPSMGNILHSFSGWLNENGDANFAVFFDNPHVDKVSVDIIGDSSATSTMYAFDKNLKFIGEADDLTGGGFETLSLSGLGDIGAIVITPGYFFDWVGVNNLTFETSGTSVPEPGAPAFVCIGALSLADWARRRLRK